MRIDAHYLRKGVAAAILETILTTARHRGYDRLSPDPNATTPAPGAWSGGLASVRHAVFCGFDLTSNRGESRQAFRESQEKLGLFSCRQDEWIVSHGVLLAVGRSKGTFYRISDR